LLQNAVLVEVIRGISHEFKYELGKGIKLGQPPISEVLNGHLVSIPKRANFLASNVKSSRLRRENLFTALAR